MSISWSSLAPTASLLSKAYILKAEVSATSRGTDFWWKGEVSSVGIRERLVSSCETSSGLSLVCAVLALFPRSSFVLPFWYRQAY
jgi:hypothetical protein